MADQLHERNNSQIARVSKLTVWTFRLANIFYGCRRPLLYARITACLAVVRMTRVWLYSTTQTKYWVYKEKHGNVLSSSTVNYEIQVKQKHLIA